MDVISGELDDIIDYGIRKVDSFSGINTYDLHPVRYQVCTIIEGQDEDAVPEDFDSLGNPWKSRHG
jgi:hypothetical protein